MQWFIALGIVALLGLSQVGHLLCAWAPPLAHASGGGGDSESGENGGDGDGSDDDGGDD